MTNDNDLVRRGDALTILSNGSQTWGEAVAAIAALPAVAASQTADPAVNADSRQRVTVKPLVWKQRKGRNGPEWDTLCDLLKVGWTAYNEDGKRAIEAHRASRILAFIDVQPDPRDEVIARLVEALEMMRSTYPYNPPCYGWQEQVEAHKTAKAAIAAAKVVHP